METIKDSLEYIAYKHNRDLGMSHEALAAVEGFAIGRIGDFKTEYEEPELLEFIECDISGQLKADGIKGQYWIDEGAWTHMVRVTTTHAGPEIQKLGAYHSVEDAMKEANELDREKDGE
jgi:hypothetical protein